MTELENMQNCCRDAGFSPVSSHAWDKDGLRVLLSRRGDSYGQAFFLKSPWVSLKPLKPITVDALVALPTQAPEIPSGMHAVPHFTGNVELADDEHADMTFTRSFDGTWYVNYLDWQKNAEMHVSAEGASPEEARRNLWTKAIEKWQARAKELQRQLSSVESMVDMAQDELAMLNTVQASGGASDD